MTTIASPKYRERLAYQAMLLGGVCYLVSMLLIGGKLSTEQLIEQHIINDQLMMLEQVLPADSYNNNPLTEATLIEFPEYFKEPVKILPAKTGNQLSGAALIATTPGWGGDMQFIVGLDELGTVQGVRVISHKETPGLADKIELSKDQWILSFNGKSLGNTSKIQWAVEKDGGEFDQFTGATITPRALVNGVYDTLQVYQTWRNQGTETMGTLTTETATRGESSQ